MFVDKAKVHLKAGKGGDGLISFKHEKYVANGGPFGGDGGDGGDIIFEADPGMTTLLDLRYNRIIRAQPGEKGKNKRMHGANASDTIVRVPLGTVVKREDTGQMIADLTEPRQQVVVAKGGRGGRGNARFKSSRDVAPRYAEPGGEGEEFDALVELRTLADVGLVGFPSVGKSTFLEAVTAAKPEIAEYPFTTISPNVGVVSVGDGRSFIMADLPGLIEGAAQGRGLGHQFLKHIERCRVIVHIVDMSGLERDPVEDYKIINQELENYHLRLMERPQIVVANKMDEENAEENLKRFKEAYPDVKVFETTAIIHEGLQPVLYEAAKLLQDTPPFPLLDENQDVSDGVLYTFEPKEKPFTITVLEPGLFKVEGPRVHQHFEMLSLKTDEDFYEFANKLRYLGIDKALKEAGAKEGDSVIIENYEFEFLEGNR